MSTRPIYSSTSRATFVVNVSSLYSRAWTGSAIDRTAGRVSEIGRLSSGIGGPLARPPLPHHRAYGSVPRRFGGLREHQVRHARQTQTLEAGVGEGAVHGGRETQSPGSLRTEDGLAGRRLRDTKTTQFMVSPATRLPLHPDDATQPSPDPAVER